MVVMAAVTTVVMVDIMGTAATVVGAGVALHSGLPSQASPSKVLTGQLIHITVHLTMPRTTRTRCMQRHRLMLSKNQLPPRQQPRVGTTAGKARRITRTSRRAKPAGRLCRRYRPICRVDSPALSGITAYFFVPRFEIALIIFSRESTSVPSGLRVALPMAATPDVRCMTLTRRL